ncbi:2-oxoglutarate ferredoxin oxidoreductase subunit beta [Hydrogenispora ethanolica]|jgi:2-oxoglutarate ferredoxin oxidoreductase subunit beta|uniref:2-oxoglutarate ferredoxin oxidoreductase subunit beta n=1 Tax=Hydrogenispora ethanolica TaxID=1082276 RepID=A0A4R1RIN1_HYDET|nr:thiamine pyrophosphate-dependent enzyme [Hydrogenispora ethanolica]TCL65963.1 2-oxoglutarate ferredoxin oxidoreductase subunit beta [Hydrogenispora ethanolica]
MEAKDFNLEHAAIAWCPGCGNFGILNALKGALAELDIAPEGLVMVSGIGQAAKTPHYLKCNFFNGLHGRALPAATAIKAANPGLTVIAESGDGDMYGEGGNHWLHTIRRNPNLTNLVHDNMVYGLTKGQASPTSPQGMITPVQVRGVVNEPFNPLAAAIALDASFVARAFSGDLQQTKEILKQAIRHPGYALVDILHPCVSFNKLNTFQWFKEHTEYLDAGHDPSDREAAFAQALRTDRLPLGVFYLNRERRPFEETLPAYADRSEPLYRRRPDLAKLAAVIATRRD